MNSFVCQKLSVCLEGIVSIKVSAALNLKRNVEHHALNRLVSNQVSVASYQSGSISKSVCYWCTKTIHQTNRNIGNDRCVVVDQNSCVTKTISADMTCGVKNIGDNNISSGTCTSVTTLIDKGDTIICSRCISTTLVDTICGIQR